MVHIPLGLLSFTAYCFPFPPPTPHPYPYPPRIDKKVQVPTSPVSNAPPLDPCARMPALAHTFPQTATSRRNRLFLVAHSCI